MTFVVSTRVADLGESTFRVDALVDDVIVGQAEVSREDAHSWTIHTIETHPDARGIGAGDAMVLRVIDEVRARGGNYLASSATPGNRQLKNLFERHGLTATSIVVGRRL